jgi:hypothetical protein
MLHLRGSGLVSPAAPHGAWFSPWQEEPGATLSNSPAAVMALRGPVIICG